MGGLVILAALIFTALLWSDVTKPEVWIFLSCVIGFAAIGFWDDRRKISGNKGIPETAKFKAQLLVGGVVVLAWYFFCAPPTELSIPFFKSSASITLGYLLLPWACFIIIGTSNAVNLTDGLDGLATGLLISNFGTFALICFCAGIGSIAAFLDIPVTQSAELSVIGAAAVGACLGFLWYNAYPAQMFMGDVGSLALGSALALMALMARQELLLIFTGCIFVLETVSVIAQVAYYKRTKKRLFKMAPLHHHFELIGWHETKITARFGIITTVVCVTIASLFCAGALIASRYC